MFLNSQDDFDFTPRESEQRSAPYGGRGGSPARKRGRGKFFLETSMNRFRDENEPNGLLMSQDSPCASQFSQDFTDRLGHLNVKSSQDDSFMIPPMETSTSNDMFSVPTAPTSKGRRLHVLGNSKRTERIETEKQIDLRTPHANPFISRTQESTEKYFSNMRGPMQKITKMWITAFKERPRYICEFQEIAILGEGTFSSVCCARHRLDGALYAIKKIKEKIVTDSQAKLMLREASALAALADCPNIVSYHGCWIEENQLYMQLELCPLGSLEDFISPHPSLCSIMHNRNRHHYFPSESTAVSVGDSTLSMMMMMDTDYGGSQGCASQPGMGSDSFLCMSQMSQNGPPSFELMMMGRERAFSHNSNDLDSLCTPRPTQDSLPPAPSKGHGALKRTTSLQQQQQQQLLDDPTSYLSQPATHSMATATTANVSASSMMEEDTTPPSKGISEPVAWLILSEVGKALVYMHARGLVHLDLRPANFFMKAVAKPSLALQSEVYALTHPSQAKNGGGRGASVASSTTTAAEPKRASLFATVMQQTSSTTAAAAAASLTQSLGDLHLQSQPTSMALLSSQPSQGSIIADQMNISGDDLSVSTSQQSFPGLAIHIPTASLVPPPPGDMTPLMTPVNTAHHQGGPGAAPVPHFPQSTVTRSKAKHPTTSSSVASSTAASSSSTTITSHASHSGVSHRHHLHPPQQQQQPPPSQQSQPSQQQLQQSTESIAMTAWSDYYQRRQLVEDGLLTGDYVIRVGDFGLCRGIFEASGFIQEGESRYCPRELINLDHTHLDLTKADVFSLAASVYELCLGRFLGASGEEGMEEWHNIRDGLFASEGWYTTFSPSLTGLIGRMLHPDPRRRPSAEEVVILASEEVTFAKAKMMAVTATATSSTTTAATAGGGGGGVVTKKEMEVMSHAELVALVQRLQTDNSRLLQQAARST